LRHPLDGLLEALRFRLPPLRLSNPLRILTLATWAESRERLRRQFVPLQRRALLRRNAHALLRRLRLALNRRNCGVVIEDVLWICSDMWQPYLDVIREKCSQALHILDRFHIVAKMNQALDDVRAAAARKMAQDGHQPPRKKTGWCVLKRKENLTSQQKFRLRDLLRYNLQTVRAYLLKENFPQFWEYNSPTWAGLLLDFWCQETMRSRIAPMKKIARTLRTHRELLLNYFKAKKQISSGVVEELNNKAKITTRRSYGFRTLRILDLALYHSLGKLPKPELTHEFF
jgi:transposase